MLETMLKSKPDAAARLSGTDAHKNLRGTVSFYQMENGVLIRAEVTGLPVGTGRCGHSVFGFHIHEGKSCSGTPRDPFADTKGHFNPDDCPHPEHAGDMPPLFADQSGFAWQSFYTTRLRVEDVLGKTVVIHADADDFHTQPSGHSGDRIGCGVIRR